MKKTLVIVLAVILAATVSLLPRAAFAYPRIITVSKTLNMSHYDPGGACGPCSGVSIGRYYRDYHSPQYLLLPNGTNYAEMYDDLYSLMGDDEWVNAYGGHWRQMAIDAGYSWSTFSAVTDIQVDNADTSPADGMPDCFAAVVNAINNNWPVALNGQFPDAGGRISTDGNSAWPTEGHYWAIRGYSYKSITVEGATATWEYRIVCTDSYSHANSLVLDWNYLVGHNDHMGTVIIKHS